MSAIAMKQAVARLEALPDRGGPAQPLVSARGLVKRFPIKGGLLGRTVARVGAVESVSFDVQKGETLGIVGESGCGKSTLARVLMQLLVQDEGEIIFDGVRVGGAGLPHKEYCRQAQMVFQDSYASLNPRMTVVDNIAFGARVHGVATSAARLRARELLEAVGLDPDRYARRYPHELSGGQRQRVNIARALALRPRLLILDEPVAALDKSVEAQVLKLLQHLKREFELTLIFISHDLNVVNYISDRVLVMYLGTVVEVGSVAQIYESPLHPYTRGLLASRLSIDPSDRVDHPLLTGDPPSPINPPPGCRFSPRCSNVEDVCRRVEPSMSDTGGRHMAACLMQAAGSGHSLARTTG